MDYDEAKKKVFSRNPSSIKTKEECYILFNNGFFGNKVKTWNNYEDILKDNYSGTVSMRSRLKRIDRNRVFYNVLVKDIPNVLEQWKTLGLDSENISYSMTPPDEKLIFQGELMNSCNGIHLLYSTLKKPMNLALREEDA